MNKQTREEVMNYIEGIERKAINSYLRSHLPDHISFEPEDWEELKTNLSGLNKYVQIGKCSKIWHYCNIYGTKEYPVVIGKHTQIGSYCEIKPDVKIGNNCRLQSYIFIPNGVTIEDYVFIAPRVTFTNDKYPSLTSERDWLPEKTLVKEGASIGAGSIIRSGITIGERSLIGLGSRILKDVEPYSVVVDLGRKIGDIREARG